jgi:hypothetical protein
VAPGPSGYAFDAGGLGALDGRDESAKRVARVLAHALRHDLPLVVPASAFAQAFYDGAKQARLSRLIEQPYVTVAPLDRGSARAIGPRRHRKRHDDVVDVHVAYIAETYDFAVVTSDGKDMRKLGIADDRLVEV